MSPRIIPASGGGGGGSSAESIVASGLGYKRANYDPHFVTSGIVAATGVIYALALPTVAGESYTGVQLQVNVAGAGSPPTGFFVGLAGYAAFGATSAMIAQSANLSGAAALTTIGYSQFPFSAPYVETATGLRCIVILENGAFTTPVTFTRISPVLPAATGLYYNSTSTGQTALPANGNNLPGTLAVGAAAGFWAALY